MTTTHTYVKKANSTLGWQRRMDATDPETGKMVPIAPQPFMRIAGRVTEGYLEVTDTSDYIRWLGMFAIDVVNKDGTLSKFMTRNLILPCVCDLLMSHFVKGTKENNVPGRTDEHYHLPTDFEELRFVADIMLKQPEKSGTRLGYEYDVQFKSEPKVHNLVTDMTGHLPVFFEMPTDPAEKLPVAATIIPEGKSGKKEQKAA